MVNQLLGGVGLVLSGAVAQGGFEAGALSTLSRRNPCILGVAGTSSGALNATLAAAGAATGQLELATDVLKKLWIEDGSWQHIADVPISDWLHLRGAFDTKRVQALVMEGLREVLSGWNGRPAPVTLTLVTTNLNTSEGPDPAVPLPTYEQAIQFRAEQIVDPSQWSRIANAAAASASFPLLFSPTSFDGAPCIDGGAVNNAPIGYLLAEPSVDTIVVMATEAPTRAAEIASLSLSAVSGRIASALIHERIAYDLGVAHRANVQCRAIVAALDADPTISEDTKRRVLAAAGSREIKLYLIQPESPLPGDAFSGFFHGDQRSACVEAGERALMKSIGD